MVNSSERLSTIIQIGANDGNDHVYSFIKSLKNKLKVVVLVEPIPFILDKLSRQYEGIENVHILNLAITSNEEERTKTLYYLKDSNYEVSSFSKEHVIVRDPIRQYQVAEMEVKCKTLNGLFEDFGLKELDYLFIDTEGSDIPILESVDFRKYKIHNIVFEAIHSDGPHNIGSNYIKFVNTLQYIGYSVRELDHNNRVAYLDNGIY